MSSPRASSGRRVFVVDSCGICRVVDARPLRGSFYAGLTSLWDLFVLLARLAWAAGELARLEAERRNWLESPAMREWRRATSSSANVTV